MPQLPPMTPEQRAEALRKANLVTAERAKIRAGLKAGTTALPDVLAAVDGSDVIGKMKVSSLLTALPGVGKVRAERFMAEQGIDGKRRLRGLGEKQRKALEEQFPAAA